MAGICEHCGRPHGAAPEPGDAASSGQWLDAPATGDRAAGGARRPAARQVDRRLLYGVAALVAVWALFVIGAGLVSPDEVAEVDLPTATAVPQLPPPATAGPSATPTPAPEPTGVPAPTALVTEDQIPSSPDDVVRRVVSPAGQADRLARQLDRRELDLTVAWRVPGDQVVVIDLGQDMTAVVHATPPTQWALTQLADSRVLRSGPQTFLVTETFVTSIGSNSMLVAVDPRGGGGWLVAPERLEGQAEAVAWFGEPEPGATFSTPHGHQLEAVPGLGLVAWNKGPDGGWQVADKDGWLPFGADRFVTANGTAAVVEQCSAASCSLRVRYHDGSDEWPVPVGFAGVGDRVVLSPDGRKLLRIERTGLAEVYSVDDGSILWVTGRGMGQAVWAPDSSMVMWIDQIAEPELKSVFIDEKLWVSVALAALGAPEPVTTELILFDSASATPGGSAG